MVTATLDREINTASIANNKEKSLTKSLHNEIHHFVINVDIDITKTSSFLGYLNTYDFMRKASMSARSEGICIKVETSNKNLSDLILSSIHRYVDVKRTCIEVA